LLGELRCLVVVSRIEGRLPTAGLSFRIVDFDTKPPKNPDSAHPHVRKELVNEARDKESDLHPIVEKYLVQNIGVYTRKTNKRIPPG